MRRIVQAVIMFSTFTMLAMLSACTSTDDISSHTLTNLTCAGFCDYVKIDTDLDSDSKALKPDPELTPVPTSQ